MAVTPAVTGRTGADGVFKALHRICIIVQKYGPKLSAVLVAAETAGVITSAQLAVAQTFITTSSDVCDIFNLIAQYSGF